MRTGRRGTLGVSRYCLDTSAYSRFQRGDARVVELVDQADWIGMSAIVLGELRVGFLLGSRREENEELLRAFLANPAVEELDVGPEVSRHYAEIVVNLRRTGTPIPTNDVWIAATAAQAGAIVLSYDDHFEAVARVGSMVLTKA
ncbi:MAG: type II toxin-antitoxin system VapC family toxin [Gemmatimonadota bacterium]